MFWIEFLLMTAFNLGVCVLLPRLITLDWGQLFQKWVKPKQSVKQQTPHLDVGSSLSHCNR